MLSLNEKVYFCYLLWYLCIIPIQNNVTYFCNLDDGSNSFHYGIKLLLCLLIRNFGR